MKKKVVLEICTTDSIEKQVRDISNFLYNEVYADVYNGITYTLMKENNNVNFEYTFSQMEQMKEVLEKILKFREKQEKEHD